MWVDILFNPCPGVPIHQYALDDIERTKFPGDDPPAKFPYKTVIGVVDNDNPGTQKGTDRV